MIHDGDLAEIARMQDAEVALWAREMDESTRLTWLWAMLFGPLYFAAHGFPGQALKVLALSLVLVGPVLAPFIARAAWRRRGAERARWLHAMLAARADA